MSFLKDLTAHLPKGKKPQSAEYFFALNVGLSQVTASVWSVLGNHLDILGQSVQDYKDTDDLVVQANQALDQALGAFETEPAKILFGVPDGWLLDDNLKEPYLKLLRSMLKEYGLEPLAYVATSHALTHYLQKEEGAPPTAIFLELGQFLVATIVQGGKILGNKAIKHTGDLYENVEKLLLGFHDVDTLPNRILIYTADQNEDLVKAKNQLMSFPWMQKLPFLHFPKVDTLPDAVITSSLVFAGASEINPDVDFKMSSLVVGLPNKIQSLMEDTVENAKEELSNIGFVAGDILDDPEGPIVHNSHLSAHHHPLSPTINEPSDIQPVADRVSILNQVRKIFGGEKSGFKKWGLILGGLVLVFLTAYILLIKVHITILVDPRVLEKDAQVIADPKVTAVDQVNNIIPGVIVEATVTGTGSGNATGQKQIGNPARGQIIVYNKTSASKNLAAGTTLIAAGNMRFTLDSGVNVASQSAVEGGISFGKATSSVTAAAIGPDSNIAAGTELSIGGFDALAVSAKVDQALTGGTSKNVTVVTADDQKKLQAQVTNDLRQKAIGDLGGKLTDGHKLPADALSVMDSKFTFNKTVNDQTSSFTVNATVRFKGTSYADADLKTVLGKLVETNVPEGFELNLQETETQADISKVDKDGKVYFLGRFKAKLLPKFDMADLKNKINGRSTSDVANILRRIDNVVGSEIVFNPPVPSQFALMPLLDNNITISISPK